MKFLMCVTSVLAHFWSHICCLDTHFDVLGCQLDTQEVQNIPRGRPVILPDWSWSWLGSWSGLGDRLCFGPAGSGSIRTLTVIGLHVFRNVLTEINPKRSSHAWQGDLDPPVWSVWILLPWRTACAWWAWAPANHQMVVATLGQVHSTTLVLLGVLCSVWANGILWFGDPRQSRGVSWPGAPRGSAPAARGAAGGGAPPVAGAVRPPSGAVASAPSSCRPPSYCSYKPLPC